MFDEFQPPQPGEPPPKLSVAKPLIGMAICVCIGVVGFLVGFETMCGPGSGFNGGGSNPTSSAAFFVFFASVACGLGCLIWSVIVMAKNYYRS